MVTAEVSTPLYDPEWRETLTIKRGEVHTVYIPKELKGVGTEQVRNIKLPKMYLKFVEVYDSLSRLVIC